MSHWRISPEVQHEDPRAQGLSGLFCLPGGGLQCIVSEIPFLSLPDRVKRTSSRG